MSETTKTTLVKAEAPAGETYEARAHVVSGASSGPAQATTRHCAPGPQDVDMASLK